MNVLVVSRSEDLERPDGAFTTLVQLGARVRGVDAEEHFELDPELATDPPDVAVVEASDEGGTAARAVATRLRGSRALGRMPILLGAPARALVGIDPRDDTFDDVIVQPYSSAELYLRLRRAEWRRGEFVGEELVKLGTLVVDLSSWVVKIDGRPVDLTRQEFSLLRFLLHNRGRVFSRDELLLRVWGVSGCSSRTVDMHVRRLRAKLDGAGLPLETVRGIGYILRAA